MTRERREDLITVAVVASVAIHIALMFYARTKVMTHVTRDGMRHGRREVMRVEEYAPIDPVRFEVIRDIMAQKDAPEAESDDSLAPVREEMPDDVSKHWDGDIPAPKPPDSESVERIADEPERFEIKPVGVVTEEVAVPMPELEVTVPSGRMLTAAPSSDSLGPAMAVEFGTVPEVKVSMPAVSAADTVKFGFGRSEPTEFTPSEEVYEEVDEKIVEEEKQAVRELLDVGKSNPLEDFVSIGVTGCESDGWIYFRATVSPRPSLPVVPKDVVILIDASGSIGAERLSSCRKAAKAILRSAFNSGDRFNLVAFRNKFAYAFRNWAECDKASFDAADKWLSNLTAHGRTEVFETIRSVLTLPRNPSRPLIALVITDGEANVGVSDTAEILSRFTALNDGLISVYMYGVKSGANRELIDLLTRGNRGESFIHGGMRWSAGSGIESLSERFRDPVVSDLRLVFTSDSMVEAYPRLLRNLYRDGSVDIIGRVQSGTGRVRFSLRGLGGNTSYDGMFDVDLAKIVHDETVRADWDAERSIDGRLRSGE